MTEHNLHPLLCKTKQLEYIFGFAIICVNSGRTEEMNKRCNREITMWLFHLYLPYIDGVLNLMEVTCLEIKFNILMLSLCNVKYET